MAGVLYAGAVRRPQLERAQLDGLCGPAAGVALCAFGAISGAVSLLAMLATVA